ncbi:MAG: hypothetical protein K2J20_03565, partial [Bacilli bacterium]|nr:hypothetical protein [Bacilli bacterium]
MGGILNPDIIKEQIKKHFNQSVTIKVHRMRNKTNHYNGIINGIY